MGGAVIGAEFFITGCKMNSTDVKDLFNTDHVNLLNEVGETILPATKSPGAKAANVGGFMAVMVRDCYTPENQKTFMDGLGKLDDAAKKQSGGKFMDLTPKQRTDLLTACLIKSKKIITKKLRMKI